MMETWQNRETLWEEWQPFSTSGRLVVSDRIHSASAPNFADGGKRNPKQTRATMAPRPPPRNAAERMDVSSGGKEETITGRKTVPEAANRAATLTATPARHVQAGIGFRLSRIPT